MSGLKIPSKIVKALIEDKLVIFAGAGISHDPPTSLLGYKGFVQEIWSRCGAEGEPKEPYDKRLEFLQDEKHAPIKRHICEYIGTDREPNAYHKAIINILNRPNGLKVVTTNYDDCFTKVIDNLNINDVTIGIYPKFEGGYESKYIIYLHGCITDKLSHAIITFDDYCKGYIEPGAAKLFLKVLFENYIVLFIGCAFTDIMIQALFKSGIKSNARYMFVKRANVTNDFKDWNIIPIYYGNKSKVDDYSELHSILDVLSKYKDRLFELFKYKDSRSMIDLDAANNYYDSLIKAEEEVVSPIISVVDNGSEAINYLKELEDVKCYVRESENEDVYVFNEDIFNNERRFSYFTEYAQSIDWLVLLQKHSYFIQLFENPSDNLKNNIISRWLAEKFAINHRDELLYLWSIHEFKSCLPLEKWIKSILFYQYSAITADTLFLWNYIIEQSGGFNSEEYKRFEYAEIFREKINTEPTYALNILKFIVSPKIDFASEKVESIKPEFEGLDFKFGLRLRLLANQTQLLEFWELVKTHLNKLAIQILLTVCEQIELGNRLLNILGVQEDDYEPFEMAVASIEPSEQSHYRTEFTILVVFARDCIDYLVDKENACLPGFIDQWMNSKSHILKRLAIYYVWRTNSIEPDEKLAWVISEDLLFKTPVHHEVYKLLEDTYPKASKKARKGLISEALRLNLEREI